ncbi:glycosyltransferase [Rhodococcus sp. (in: high G+C Gram-positive bacteria)]|nr:glycosyltransferase [Rhodococcus sp. (in: high G+C Gram-positive bacteria)]MBF0661480.1 glycosyltransferase [Rhodococcus sp. (in: high G+C Gram-positive bacteria)]
MTARPLRIALVASNRYPIRQPFAGGLESHVWHLARALGEAGHHVTLFAASGSDESLGASHLEVRSFSPSATARHDPSMAPKGFLEDHHAYLSLMLNLAGPLADSFDVVHNHSLHYLPVAMAPALRIPMVCTLHTPPTPWLESALAATAQVPATFVAVSRHTAHAWRHALEAPATVIPNGVDLSGWPVGPGGTDLMWFGRLVPEKGAHLAIEVARRSGRRLTLAGPISDRKYFDDRIAPRLGGEVEYLGHLPRTELAARVGHSAAVLITPCWDEPYGLVVAEALACGTPVVAFARGGIPEIVDSGSGVLVPAGDTDAMAAAVPAATALSRSHARRRALEYCSERAMVKSYVALYQRLVAPAAEPVSAGRPR